MKSSFVTKGLTLLAFLAVVAYFGSSVFQYFIDPLTTTVAYRFHSEEAITVSGYLIREEVALDGVDSQLVYPTREEGEKVSRGGRVAVVYHNAQAMEAARETERLQLQLEQLEYAGSVLSGAQVAMKLDDNILEDIRTLRQQVVRGDLEEARSQAGNLRTLVVRRDFAHSATGEEDLENQAAQLRQRINSLSATAANGRTSITTKQSGYFSALVDGYEQVLTPNRLQELTPSKLESVTPSGAGSNVGKVITGEDWYFAASVPASRLEGVEPGDRVALRFISGLDRDLEMTVYLISDEEEGKRVVVLQSDRYLPLTTLLRHQTAQLILQTYDGIRVPKNAVRVAATTIEGEDGTQTEDRFTGVYCRVGMSARLKPVTVLFEGEDYYLVAPDQEILARYPEQGQSTRLLRSGDEVVITARDLYDGKAVG